MQRLSKGERDVLNMLAKGLNEREAIEKLRFEESDFAKVWSRICLKLRDMQPKTPEDTELLFRFERVERSRLDAKLRASEARLNALMDTAPEAVLVVQGWSGRILTANNNAVLMFGYELGELIGMEVENLVPQPRRAIHILYREGFLRSVRKRQLGKHPPVQAITKAGKKLVIDIALTATQATDDVMVVCRYPVEPADAPLSEAAQELTA